MNRVFCFATGVSLLFSTIGMAHADDVSPAGEKVDSQKVEKWLSDLDADEYIVREQATAALRELGEPVRERLETLLKDPPSSEVKVRALRILRALRLAEVRRHAVKLDALFEQVRLAKAGRLDREKLNAMLERLVDVLQEATGDTTFKLPVDLLELKVGGPETFVRDSLVVLSDPRDVRIASIKNSVVLADVGVNVSGCDHSIIIARAAAEVTFPKNSIVIAGYWLRASSASGSVLLSGHEADVTFPKNAIIGAAEHARTSSSANEAIFVNTKPPERAREMPKLVTTEGLLLRDERPENPLKGKIAVTHSSSGIVLFRRAGGGGELVARLNQPVVHPDGGLIEELKGWQPCYNMQSRYALFTNGERFVLMPVSR